MKIIFIILPGKAQTAAVKRDAEIGVAQVNKYKNAFFRNIKTRVEFLEV